MRRNGGNPRESGIYFTEDGDFIVEDFQNGGDRDFNDGEYAEISGGSGAAQALEESREVTRERRTTRTPLDPIRRQEGEGDIETDVVRSVQEMPLLMMCERVVMALGSLVSWHRWAIIRVCRRRC